jgi:SAM-dependent methyltransferase
MLKINNLKIPLSAPKIRILNNHFGNRNFKMLDVGAGNNSASFIKNYLPNVEYYGLDKTKNYNNNHEDFNLMVEFYEIDLLSLRFDAIKDRYFDAIVATHVIEHLETAQKPLELIYQKLKKGGLMYIEWPHPRSVKFPSMRNTLNFYDDPTHVRIYSTSEIETQFKNLGGQILSSGTVLNPLAVILLPIILAYRFIKRGYLHGPDFWYVFGFATHVLVKKS